MNRRSVVVLLHVEYADAHANGEECLVDGGHGVSFVELKGANQSSEPCVSAFDESLFRPKLAR